MSALRSRAPGKVNLCLLVGRPRPDGMHPLVSVVQPLSLADELTLAPAAPGAGGDEVSCPGVTGPNLAADALAAYRSRSGWRTEPRRLSIVKHVPVAAGMGGGSADAAAALRLAAAAAGRPGDPEAAAIAPRLGSDVAAALLARRCLMTGTGERVEALGAAGELAVLVLPSAERLSTPAVYKRFDELGGGRAEAELAEAEQRLRALADAPVPEELAVNDLAAAACSLCPSIRTALADAARAGADAAMVSGSGPTVVGLFHGASARERAQSAHERLRAAHPQAVVAEPVDDAFAAVREA